MATKGRLVAGSHNRNEFVLINAEDFGRVTSVKELSGQNCQICEDEIEVCGDEGEPFVACNECAFPVCRPCYECERREGNQACPQCKTRYKRLKGSPRVEGDEDEDDIDDLENELKYASKFTNPNDSQQIAEAMLSDRLNVGRPPSSASGFTTPAELDSAGLPTEIPLLTYGNEDAGISPENHALIPAFMSRGKKIHPVSYADSAMSLPPRPMDPKKDLALYGYGSVAWKDRMEDWKKRQNEKLEMIKHQGENGGYDGGEPEDPDLPKYVDIFTHFCYF